MTKQKMENNSQKLKIISNKLLVFDALLVLLIVLMFFLIYSVLHPVTKKDVGISGPVTHTTAFKKINLIGKSAFVYDVSTAKVLFKKNEFAQLPLASITKLMTALLATELVQRDSHITIRKEFLQEEGDSGLLSGESWRLKDLLDFSLMVSSNDGARSIASVVGALNLKSNDYDLGRKDFIAKMNERAKELGLKETYFINESGLDENGLSGGYGSAIDVAKLMEYILTNRPEILEATKYQSVNINSLTKSHLAINTNIDINQIPGLMASKTGYTDLAGGNLIVTFDASIGRPIIVVVLGSSEEGRFADVDTLVKASLEYIRESH